MKKAKFLIALCLSLALYAKDNFNDDDINEAYFNEMLYPLINGASCDKSFLAHQRHLYSTNIINVSANAMLDSKKQDLNKNLVFQGQLLRGGIFDKQENAFISDDRRFSYTLENNTLQVRAICEKQSFKISNFSNKDFGITLSNNPGKEVAIVLNTNTSMDKHLYLFAFKEIAPFLAKHIFKEDKYSKITLITFSYIYSTDLGTFYNEKDFVESLKQIQGINSQSNVINVSLIKAMSNFTKDNGLKKEIYLISDDTSKDISRTQEMLQFTKNLNANLAKNAKPNVNNFVKINTFALKPNLDYLKQIAKATNGTYNEANNVYDFKKQLLSLSNDGKPFDMRELDNEIRPSKTNKIYDDDKPDGKK